MMGTSGLSVSRAHVSHGVALPLMHGAGPHSHVLHWE